MDAREERARVARILRRLRRLYPDARCALEHRNAYELLVATILSAQSTDARVNQTMPELLARYPTVERLARARPATLERVVHSCGFFRAKARNLIGMARRVVADHGGEIPGTMAELVLLPGVARKTANVVLGTAFSTASGVVVDTHVGRLARRLCLSRQRDPGKVETDLMQIIPERRWIQLSHELIHHGRQVCRARRPDCDGCKLAPDCPAGARGGEPPARRRSAAEILAST
jgi:endonuclease-3